ncbi:OmpA family protein [Sphingomonas sp. NSE70-1]|uniref:OmpA family protein n=1 Tax=Sphingomonas caseinilyticus TaxID=2908205 RepID=A0ABT0RWU3_9SPHN|nr:OmpA family protein [Sphingomonas caseinilyticus]MCL6699478.1 OmpA family protein [Sphingomonas caseinilyticus]
MKGKLGTIAAGLLISVAAVPAVAEEVKTEAVITSVSGNTINAKSMAGPLTVVLTPETKIVQTSGIAKRETRDAGALIPGLIFTVEGDNQGGTITAEDIKFKEKDWRTAIATKAGTVEQFSELRKAIIEGQEYVIQDETTVYFKVGSSTISAADKANLKALAEKAPSFGNYRISILGFADPTGNAAANERLSLKRAGAVSNYLRQTGKINPGRVLSPSAMGEEGSAPDIAAPTNNEEARRVVVRVVTPKTQLTQ